MLDIEESDPEGLWQNNYGISGQEGCKMLVP